jgi:hypothetical protein
MGQIIRLPAGLTTYPDTSTDLDPVECVVLIGVRWWVESYRRDEDPLPRLCQGLDSAGACDAAFAIDRLMTIVARAPLRPITIHCPRCPHLSDDERHLLHAASLAQTGHDHLTEKALRTALLSAEGAECALDPLRDLAGLLAEAGLFFRRRRPPGTDQASAEVVALRQAIH